tara:strand:- start:785 stop:1624 length:840 start_codon:yes stop_codon:yes gene_type:complete
VSSLLDNYVVKAFTKEQFDITNSKCIEHLISNEDPDIIINAAAYTDVDKAELNLSIAESINSNGPMFIAKQLKNTNKLFIHYSTDYVFDGEAKNPYKETDMPSPINNYGHTKLLGEKYIIDSDINYLIFRTTWVYSIGTNNFPNKIIKLYKKNKPLKIVSDQFGVPTSAKMIADITKECIEKYFSTKDSKLKGIYHLTPTGATDWYNFSKYIIDELNEKKYFKKTNSIMPCKTDEYKLPAKRPKNSLLNCNKIKECFNIFLPDWKYHANLFIEEIYKNK